MRQEGAYVLIELCEANEMMTVAKMLEDAHFEVMTYSCLDRCVDCANAPYALVEGIYLEGHDPHQLLTLLLDIKET